MACTVEQFLDFLKKEEKSEATISRYAYELQMFLQFLGKREIEFSTAPISAVGTAHRRSTASCRQ